MMKIDNTKKLSKSVFLKNKIWLSIVLAMVIVALFYPLFSPYSPDDFSFAPSLHPTVLHILGTDDMGHDIFSMLLSGFRITILISLISALISTLIGTIFGVLSAYYKGWIDSIIVRTSELFIVIPEIVVILFFAAYSRPRIENTIFAIAFFSWSKVTRIIRSKAVIAMKEDKVRYTILMKGKFFDVVRKMWREIYPSASTMFILQCSKAAVYETTLSFFGIGDPLAKSWGRMIKTALNYEGIFENGMYLWYLIPPIFCICLFVVSLSTITFSSYDE